MSRPASSRTKLLRSVSGIGGVSDRSLASILDWVRAHPEVDRAVDSTQPFPLTSR